MTQCNALKNSIFRVSDENITNFRKIVSNSSADVTKPYNFFFKVLLNISRSEENFSPLG